MRRHQIVSLLSLLATVALLLGACGSVPGGGAPAPGATPAAGGAPTTAAGGGAANKPLKIAFSIPDLAFPFFVHMEKQIKDEAAKIGNIEIITLDGTNKVPKQTADLEGVIAQKLDGVIVSPIDAQAMAPAVKEVIDAKIPLVTVDRNVVGVETLGHVGADNVKGGEAQGEYVLKILPNGGNIFELLGTPGASPAIDRDKGLKNVISKQDKVKIVFEQTANFKRPDGLSVTEAGLGANPNPEAIVCANDDMALGAVEAAKAKGLKAPIIGYDALPEALKAIQSGDMAGTVEQFPGQQVRGALKVLVDFLRNGTKPAQHDTFITPKMITKDNINEAERIGEVK